MTIFDAIILGLVEGITEFLPISSTGHLVLAASLLGLDGSEDIRRSTDALLIVIQGGAILAVLGLYRTSIWSMIRGLAGRDPRGFQLARNCFIAFLPAALIGPLLDDWIEARLMHPVPVLFALAAGGVIMLLASRGKPKADHSKEVKDLSAADLSMSAALQIGLLQCIAMWPGTSRSMVTILGGMWVGLRPARAAEFSFILGLPTLGGATVYKLIKNVSGDDANMFEVLGWTPVVIGIMAAFVSAAIAIKWLVAWLNTHGLTVFGWYRIGLTIVLGFMMAQGWVQFTPKTPAEDATVRAQGVDSATWSILTATPATCTCPASSTVRRFTWLASDQTEDSILDVPADVVTTVNGAAVRNGPPLGTAIQVSSSCLHRVYRTAPAT